MKKIFFTFLVFLFCPSVLAYSSNAEATILMDMDSNKVIYENNMNTKRSVASISKIMTAIVAIESGKLNDKVIVGDEVLKSHGSGIYIKVEEEMTLKDLLYGLMLRSGNDASLAIAKYVGGSVDNFIVMMNDKAEKIGMKNSVFNNPNGLDEKGGNISTAYDMAILTSYAMKNNDYKEIVKTKKYTLKTNMSYYSWTNKHKLINNNYITGGKTGFTKMAKRTLVTTASKNNVNLVVVTLNDGSDFSDHINLLEEAFLNYTNYQVLKKGNVDIIGENYYNNVIFYIKNNINCTLENNVKNVVLEYKLEKKFNYKNNDKVGYVNVIVNNKLVHKEDVFIEEKDSSSIFERVRRWFH